jgi:tRNA threonylcarbamoyladenosine biosynthesis protein TsaB
MTGNILILETSTDAGSVAVARDGQLVAQVEFTSRRGATGAHREALAPAVASCLAEAGVAARELSAIVCGSGPGGFTSLRSAAAFGKGICSALSLPLFGISSLELLGLSAGLAEGSYVVALPAGRNEWFAAHTVRSADGSATTGDWFLAGEDALRARTAETGARLVGPGLDRDISPRAAAAIGALGLVHARGPVDLDSWEPAYGRAAEAQVKWEAEHGRPLTS